MDIRKVSVELLKPWADNPRDISAVDYERLRKQIIALGVYKPLLVAEDGEGYVVLGGNMRIRAFKELKITEIEVSVVKAPTTADKVKYALSDNDRAGVYDQRRLAKLIRADRERIEMADYKIDAGWLFTLDEVVSTNPDENAEADNMARPEFKAIVETFGEGDKGKAKENGDWFYVEYYGETELFEQMLAYFQSIGMIKGRHEINPKFFVSLVLKDPKTVNEALSDIRREAPLTVLDGEGSFPEVPENIPEGETLTEEDETPPTQFLPGFDPSSLFGNEEKEGVKDEV